MKPLGWNVQPLRNRFCNLFSYCQVVTVNWTAVAKPLGLIVQLLRNRYCKLFSYCQVVTVNWTAVAKLLGWIVQPLQNHYCKLCSRCETVTVNCTAVAILLCWIVQPLRMRNYSFESLWQRGRVTVKVFSAIYKIKRFMHRHSIVNRTLYFICRRLSQIFEN